MTQNQLKKYAKIVQLTNRPPKEIRFNIMW